MKSVMGNMYMLQVMLHATWYKFIPCIESKRCIWFFFLFSCAITQRVFTSNQCRYGQILFTEVVVYLCPDLVDFCFPPFTVNHLNIVWIDSRSSLNQVLNSSNQLTNHRSVSHSCKFRKLCVSKETKKIDLGIIPLRVCVYSLEGNN